MLHGAGIFTYIWFIFRVNVGKYSSTIEHLGSAKISFSVDVDYNFKKHGTHLEQKQVGLSKIVQTTMRCLTTHIGFIYCFYVLFSSQVEIYCRKHSTFSNMEPNYIYGGFLRKGYPQIIQLMFEMSIITIYGNPHIWILLLIHQPEIK